MFNVKIYNWLTPQNFNQDVVGDPHIAFTKVWGKSHFFENVIGEENGIGGGGSAVLAKEEFGRIWKVLRIKHRRERERRNR